MCQPMKKTCVDAIAEGVDNNAPRHLHTHNDVGSHLGEVYAQLQENGGRVPVGEHHYAKWGRAQPT